MSQDIYSFEYDGELRNAVEQSAAYSKRFFPQSRLLCLVIVWGPVIAAFAVIFPLLPWLVPWTDEFFGSLGLSWPLMPLALVALFYGSVMLLTKLIRAWLVPLYRDKAYAGIEATMPSTRMALRFDGETLLWSSAGCTVSVPVQRVFAVLQSKAGMTVGSDLITIFISEVAFASPSMKSDFKQSLWSALSEAARARSSESFW